MQQSHNPALKFAPSGRWDAPSARPLSYTLDLANMKIHRQIAVIVLVSIAASVAICYQMMVFITLPSTFEFGNTFVHVLRVFNKEGYFSDRILAILGSGFVWELALKLTCVLLVIWWSGKAIYAKVKTKKV